MKIFYLVLLPLVYKTEYFVLENKCRLVLTVTNEKSGFRFCSSFFPVSLHSGSFAYVNTKNVSVIHLDQSYYITTR
jgi:hypothetical protein